jgi:hypothetical protein
MIDAVLFVVLGVGAVFATMQLPSIWSGEAVPRIERNLRRAWPFSPALLRGTIRAMPAGIVGFSSFLFAAITGTVFAVAPEGIAQIALAIAYILAATAAIASTFCVVGVTLLNVPRTVVPPTMRHEPGAIAEWRQRQAPRKGVERGRFRRKDE